MRGLEEQLSEIAKQQGVNANEIVLLVQENEEILSKQKANLKVSFNYLHHLHDYIVINCDLTLLNNTTCHHSKPLSATWLELSFPPNSSLEI